MEKTKPKVVNYIRPVYTAEDCFKVVESIIRNHPQLSFIQATEADHALNSLMIHLELGIKKVKIEKEGKEGKEEKKEKKEEVKEKHEQSQLEKK